MCSDGKPLFKQIAFFDLDQTLIKKNSSFSFGSFLYKKKIISFFTVFKLVSAYFLYKIGFLKLKKIHQYSFKILFSGKCKNHFDALSQEFLDSHFDHLTNIHLAEIFDRLKRDHTVIILSSSPDFLVSPFAKRFGAHSFCATSYCYNEENQFVDLKEVFEGEQKRDYVRKVATNFDIKYEDLSAYSDSHLDIPFLAAVGNPVAVNPTMTLRKHALLNSWEIINSSKF